MSEVIVLSDSNDSVSSTENNKCRKSNKTDNNKLLHDDSSSSDFNYPEFHIQGVIHADKSTDKRCNGNDMINTDPFEDNVNELRKSLSESPLENNDIPCTSYDALNKCNIRKTLAGLHYSSDKYDSDEENVDREQQKKRKPTAKKNNKMKSTEEKIKKQEELARKKALRAIELKKSKDIKPGECMKFMEVILDKGIDHFPFSNDIRTALAEGNVKYNINEEIVPNSITWRRNIEKCYVDETNEIRTVIETEIIKQILVIWNWDEAIRKIEDDTFSSSVSSIKALLMDYNLTLVIYGIEDYFAYSKQAKSNAKNGTKNKRQKNDDKRIEEFKNAPQISRRKLETCLNEIQILAMSNSRLINSPQDMASMIYQYTKSIAEIPYKLEKNKNLEKKCDWYVMGDNRNTVRVDKDGNGLKRLWQQQLCQFNLSSLEIAEAICSVYPSPASLMEAYMNCTHEEGMNLLKDIPIRRAAGPLSTTRKIGLELSKKVYTMFSSEDGDTVLH